MAQENPVLDRTIREFLNKLAANAGPPVYQLTPDEARSTLLRAQSALSASQMLKSKTGSVDSAVGALRLRTIRPHSARISSSVIMYFHGGGWVMGDATTHDRLVRELAVGSDATVVLVDYDRAPEHRYPVAIEQAYATTQHVSEHSEEFRGDATRLAVVGESSRWFNVSSDIVSR
jgi:acetyl esterase